MTNAEKFLKDETRAEFFEAYKEYVKKRVHINEEEYTAGENLIETFMQLEIKPTLTEDERVILKNLIGCEWKIGREKSGELYLITVAHTKRYFGMYLHLFQFIKERRRI